MFEISRPYNSSLSYSGRFNRDRGGEGLFFILAQNNRTIDNLVCLWFLAVLVGACLLALSDTTRVA